MRSLEEIDPELIDQAVRRMMKNRAVDREIAIATHMGESKELMEFVEMILHEPPADADPRIAGMARLMSAVSIGLEVGYALGAHEAQRQIRGASG